MAVRILIVDDDPKSRQVFTIVMQRYFPDAVVDGAEDGEQCLERVAAARPDVLVLDVNLPGISGMDVCRTLKNDPALSHIPILMISGIMTGENDRVEGLLQGADGYLCKPCAPAELVAMIRALLRVKAYEDQLLTHQRELELELERRTVKLQEHELVYRRLFETVGDACVIIDGDSLALVQVNEAAVSLYGYSGEELLRLGVLDISAEPEATRQAFQDLRRNGRIHIRERRHRKKDGAVFPVEISAGSFMLQGRLMVCAIVRDITVRRSMEEALRASEAKYRHVTESVPVVIYSVGPEESSSSLFVTARIAELTGFREQEFMRDPRLLDRLIHPDDLERVKQAWRDLRECRVQLDAEFRIVTADGTVKWVRDKAVPELSADGSILRIDGYMEDITSRKKVELALQQSENRHRLLLEHADIGIAYWDAKGSLLLFNPVASEHLGGIPMDAVGKSAEELLGPELGIPCLERIRLASGGETVECLQAVRLPSGLKWLVSHYARIVDHEGQVLGVQVLTTDVTEQKRAEERLRVYGERLRALANRVESIREEERTRISRQIHDELGHALAGIKLELAALDKRIHAGCADVMGPEIEERMAALKQQLDKTIDSVRQISAELRPGILDHLGLAAAIEWEASEFQRRTGIVCAMDLAQDVGFTPTQATALFRVFQETLANVAQHAEARKLSIRLYGGRKQITMEVQDYGRGISRDKLSATDSLGLLGMEERIRALGGTLTIRGRKGEGTTVTAKVPL